MTALSALTPPTTADLPPLPEALARLAFASSSSGEPRERVVRLLEGSRVASALLFLVNNAYRNIPMRLSNLKIASAYLGVEEIARQTRGLLAVEALCEGNEQAWKLYLRRGTALGLIAAQLCRRFEPALDPRELWPTALLIDLGQLFREQRLPEVAAALRREQALSGCSLRQAEEVLGLRSHGEVGAEICARWKLGDEARLACLHHQGCEPGAGTMLQRDRRRMLMVADRLLQLALRTSATKLQDELSREVVELLGLPNDKQLPYLLARAEQPLRTAVRI